MSLRNPLLTILAIVGLALGLVWPGAPTPQAAAAASGRTSLISYAPARLPSGMAATYASGWAASLPDISADGDRIVFATNLGMAPEDTNRLTDIYLYDRPARAFILASPTPAGPDGRRAAGIDGVSTAVVSRISHDGRYVVYASTSHGLIAADTNPQYDVYLFDSATGLVHLASQSYDGSALNDIVSWPDVTSVGGRIWVVFQTASPKIVPGDTNGVADVFMRDMVTGETVRVSLGNDGAQADGASGQPAISRDGNWVAFYSRATNLVPGDTNGLGDIFVRNLLNNTTVRISVGPGGAEANGESQAPDISGDGGRVIFRSAATNLVANDTNGVVDVFVSNRGDGSVTRASVSGDGAQGDKLSGGWNDALSLPAVSHDGRFVTFPSQATNLVVGDTNGASDSFVRDLEAGTTERLNIAPGGAQGGGTGSTIHIADGGQLATFHGGSDLSPMLINMFMGVFLRDRSAAPSPPTVTIDAPWPNPALQVPLVDVHLVGRATDTDGDPASTIVGYAWVSSLDRVVAQAASASPAASSLSIGIHSFTLVVIDDDGEAAVAGPGEVRVMAPGADQIKTLIITNIARLHALYPGDPNVDALEARLAQLAAHQQVRGRVIDVGADAQTALAYTTWEREPTTVRANQLVERIKGQIDRAWGGYPALAYLVIVGDDRVIPFRRVPDRMPAVSDGWPTESSYAEQNLIPAGSTVGRALRDNQILTDDYYAYNTARYGLGKLAPPRYFLPELGTGRLVERPAEMLAAIDTFLGGDSVAVAKAAVSAQVGDLAEDLGARACARLAADGLIVDCSLVVAAWTANDFRSRVLGAGVRNDIVSFQHHAYHGGFGITNNLVTAGDLAGAGADLARAMLTTVGCHAGLNVPPYDERYALDLPQAALSRQANYLASTGYGIGCAGCVAWTEQLIDLFEHELVSGGSATPGQALAAAKAAYHQAPLYPGDTEGDEKASLQLTLYGLPMYRYQTPGTALTATAPEGGVEVGMSSRQLAAGLTVNSFTYRFPPLDEVVTAGGRYYTLNGEAAVGNQEPVQPRYTADLSFPGTRAHGVVFRGGSYAPLADFDPVVAAMMNEYVSAAEPGLSGEAWRPALPARVNSLGDGATMVAALGQYQPSSRTERVFQSLALDVYYHTDSADVAAPWIKAMRSLRSGDQAAISVEATDPAGVAAVVVAYTTGAGEWRSLELALAGGVWAGTIPAGETTRLFVQAVDGAGNVATIDNGGAYYGPTSVGKAPASLYLPLLAR